MTPRAGAPWRSAGAATVVATALLAGCALVPPASAPPPGAGVPTAIAFGRFEFAGEALDTEWQLPAGDSAGLVLVQHGFARRCANLRTTAQRIAAQGATTLCIDTGPVGDTAALADTLAAAILHGLTAPDGRAVPPRVVVAGHSAGAAFAARVGRALAWADASRLGGAVLFDPVATGGFAANLAAIADGGRRPVYAVMAASGGCNARHNALPALQRVVDAARAAGGDGFVGVELTQGSTHVDAEGEDTDALAVLACRQGPPSPANTEALRTLAARWALDLLRGGRAADAYPGRPYVDGLVASARATSLTSAGPR
ncbi:alpha/beta hydrolase [Calidifontimicrobium sp. SYSU G02091]|uniref:alpha/beta hydrolase n=1 Tax=Calidifontimicrobium sp. SYSU G02091 TaxID=2926421 RepID=UPI001F53D712|nr:alpha/beta hydrolase [Calidifontimicrobium sp. SYSU G02091]